MQNQMVQKTAKFEWHQMESHAQLKYTNSPRPIFYEHTIFDNDKTSPCEMLSDSHHSSGGVDNSIKSNVIT